MGVYRDQAIVLRTMRYAEADRIVTLLTHTHGKLRSIVKGVRKTKSRIGARIEPFCHADVMLYEGRGDLQTVSQAELITAHDAIRRDYETYSCAQVICEATDKVSPDGERNTRLVMLVLASLRALDACGRAGDRLPDSFAAAFLLKLLGVTGFGPGLRSCVHCGGSEGLSAFSLGEGGVICGSCRGPGDVSVAFHSIEVLRILWSTRFEDLREAMDASADVTRSGEVDGLAQRLFEYHIERPLRSLATAF